MTSTPYREDLAWIQHVGFGDHAEAAVAAAREWLVAAGLAGGRVVELGCGDGRALRALADAGFEAVGFDVSEALVRIARRLAPSAHVRVGSAHEVVLPACDAVIAFGEALAYLPPDGTQPSLPRLYERVAAALRPGGLFVFDLIEGRRSPSLAARGWRAGDDWLVAMAAAENDERTLLTRDIVAFRRARGRWRRSEERHRLQLPTRAEVEGALRAAGFSVRVLRRYGDFPLLPRRLAFRARRPRSGATALSARGTPPGRRAHRGTFG